MTVVEALSAYVVAAGLLTLTPGLDTALILRTAAVEGPRRAAFAAMGINVGCLIWGGVVALGLGALLATSILAFTVLKYVGAAYLLWLGLNLILRPRDAFQVSPISASADSDLAWMRRGLLTNVLNPKVGVFYVSFLPQFLADGVQAGPFIFLLAVIHVVLGSAWSTVLIMGTRPIADVLQRAAVVRWLDRVTGGVFLAFGVRLALERR